MRLEPVLRVLLLASLLLVLAACDTAPKRGGNSNDERRQAAETHVQLGQSYLQRGELETALEKLEKALKFDPDFPDAHTVIAVLYERIGDMKNAETHYRRAAELTPKNGAVLNNYGRFLCNAGKLDQAEKYFARAIADPFYKSPETAYVNSGTCRLRAGQLATAEADFRQALTLNAQNADALYHLASICYQKADYLRARAFIQRFEALAQADPASLLLGHDIELKLGNQNAAQDYGKRLEVQFPDSEQARALDPRKSS